MEYTMYSFVAVGVIWALYRLLCVGRRPKDYPPGPPTIPVLGNLHLMPTKDAHLQFQQWAKEYGPIYSLMLGTKTMVVLSKDQVVRDLLDKKGPIYSSRPDLYTALTLVSGGLRMGLTDYGPVWRRSRKLCHDALNIRKSTAYMPYQEVENKQFLHDLMLSPSQAFDHCRRYASSVTTSILYGFRWKTADDPHLQTFLRSVDSMVEILTMGTAALVDFFPILRSLPVWLSPMKKRAHRHHIAEKQLYRSYWLKAKNAILDKTLSAASCVCVDIVKAQEQAQFNDDYAAYLLGTLFEAGSDTTSTEIYAFIQAMLLYPEVQKKAQEEIDTVLGESRMPTFDDQSALPYVRACVKETLRWFPTSVLGAVPHAPNEEDMYLGYRIPKGAYITLNTWTIHRDANRYPDPERFVPERFLGDDTSSADSANSSDVSKRDHFTFGAGRRICPGTHIADRSLFLALSRILWAFNVLPKKDEKGRDILPKQDDMIYGLVSIPKPFDVEFVPRNKARRAMIEREWEGLQATLNDEGQYLKNPI